MSKSTLQRIPIKEPDDDDAAPESEIGISIDPKSSETNFVAAANEADDEEILYTPASTAAGGAQQIPEEANNLVPEKLHPEKIEEISRIPNHPEPDNAEIPSEDSDDIIHSKPTMIATSVPYDDGSSHEEHLNSSIQDDIGATESEAANLGKETFLEPSNHSIIEDEAGIGNEYRNTYTESASPKEENSAENVVEKTEFGGDEAGEDLIEEPAFDLHPPGEDRTTIKEAINQEQDTNESEKKQAGKQGEEHHPEEHFIIIQKPETKDENDKEQAEIADDNKPAIDIKPEESIDGETLQKQYEAESIDNAQTYADDSREKAEKEDETKYAEISTTTEDEPKANKQEEIGLPSKEEFESAHESKYQGNDDSSVQIQIPSETAEATSFEESFAAEKYKEVGGEATTQSRKTGLEEETLEVDLPSDKIKRDDQESEVKDPHSLNEEEAVEGSINQEQQTSTEENSETLKDGTIDTVFSTIKEDEAAKQQHQSSYENDEINDIQVFDDDVQQVKTKDTVGDANTVDEAKLAVEEHQSIASAEHFDDASKEDEANKQETAETKETREVEQVHEGSLGSYGEAIEHHPIEILQETKQIDENTLQNEQEKTNQTVTTELESGTADAYIKSDTEDSRERIEKESEISEDYQDKYDEPESENTVAQPEDELKTEEETSKQGPGDVKSHHEPENETKTEENLDNAAEAYTSKQPPEDVESAAYEPEKQDNEFIERTHSELEEKVTDDNIDETTTEVKTEEETSEQGGPVDVKSPIEPEKQNDEFNEQVQSLSKEEKTNAVKNLNVAEEIKTEAVEEVVSQSDKSTHEKDTVEDFDIPSEEIKIEDEEVRHTDQSSFEAEETAKNTLEEEKIKEEDENATDTQQGSTTSEIITRYSQADQETKQAEAKTEEFDEDTETVDNAEKAAKDVEERQLDSTEKDAINDGPIESILEKEEVKNITENIHNTIEANETEKVPEGHEEFLGIVAKHPSTNEKENEEAEASEYRSHDDENAVTQSQQEDEENKEDTKKQEIVQVENAYESKEYENESTVQADNLIQVDEPEENLEAPAVIKVEEALAGPQIHQNLLENQVGNEDEEHQLDSFKENVIEEKTTDELADKEKNEEIKEAIEIKQKALKILIPRSLKTCMKVHC
ncbi:hypothetical protein M569_01572 [Genlisea aurea]|uniref:Uncharacterized protein n=1 Tax=Genlisea aurea TaxID=192259 RepID=S8D081_9LAMI|nr:hypothetical protein M569_01572 [Genlisea aurea]